MNIKIIIMPGALHQLDKYSKDVQQNIKSVINSLSFNPLPCDVKPVVEKKDFLRLSVGDYSIIYTVNNNEIIVLIISPKKM